MCILCVYKEYLSCNSAQISNDKNFFLYIKDQKIVEKFILPEIVGTFHCVV